MVPQKKDNPSVPIEPNEIIEQVHEAYEIGITIAHLHARDSDGTPTYKKSTYQEIFEGVRKHCPELVICGSTSGRNFPEFEKRSEVIELAPDMCSLTLSSLNFINGASVNPPDIIVKLWDKMEFFGVNPELECFDLGMINYGKYLIGNSEYQGPYYWNLLFGNIAGMQSNFNAFASALNEIPHGHFASMAGLGKYQLEVNTCAISMNHGVRVGLEDNIWMDQDKSMPATNVDLVRRVHKVANMQDKKIMNATKFGRLGFYNRKTSKLIENNVKN